MQRIDCERMGSLAIRSPLRAFLLLLAVTCLDACGGGQSTPLTQPPPTSAPVTLKSLAITPDAGSGAAGTLTQLAATGTFSDGSKSDVSSQVTWASSSTAIADVNSQGMLSAFTQGNVTVSASLAGASASTTFTVTAPILVGIEITPAPHRIWRTAAPCSSLRPVCSRTTQLKI